MDTLPVKPLHPQAARPRVLFVITQAEWGGAQVFFLQAAQAAVRRGYDVLMTAGGTGPLEDRCRAANIPYRRLERLKRELSVIDDFAAIQELRGIIREFKPDTVFLNSSKVGVVGSIVAWMSDVKRVVYRIGGWSFLDPVSPMQKFIRRWSEKLTAGLKDVIITVHPGDEAMAKTIGIRPRQQLITIPNGLDVSTFDRSLLAHTDARAELLEFNPKIPPDAQILLTVANFYPTKGLGDYLEALSIVCRQHPKIHAIVIGDGELRVELEGKRRTLNLETHVTFAGRQADASRLMDGADLFVLPSRKEGMSWALLEAMASSVPIVATDAGAARWMLGDAGWIVPPQQPEALARAIDAALNDPQRAALMGMNARKRVETTFSQDVMLDKLFTVLK
jgi:glycosyltransferase involved in cell wall biosynthesis